MSNPRTLLILGNDKIGRRLSIDLAALPDVAVVRDMSSSWKRAYRLVKKGRIRLFDLLRIAWAEFSRPPVDEVPELSEIRTNSDLLSLIATAKPERIILFRAGLIISRNVLQIGIPIQNIHCASLNGYGGLASIARALRDGAWAQEATLHQVTTRIDDGAILDTESFTLLPGISYAANENTAYAAGEKLLRRTLQQEAKE